MTITMKAPVFVSLLLSLLRWSAVGASPEQERVVTRTCNSDTFYNNTIFSNPRYPEYEYGPLTDCDFTIHPTTANICQVRLDLEVFSLNQPTPEGFCNVDYMTITGATNNAPTLCGDNAGHHMYADIEQSTTAAITLSLFLSRQTTAGRRWRMQIKQIECDSIYRAPDGCLQYHTSINGVVSSFNYQSETIPSATRQLSRQEYSVCVKTHPEYCSIIWSNPEPDWIYYFTVTGDADVIAPGVGGVPLTGDACTTDYVIVPNGAITDPTVVASSADRFCGSRFPDTVTSAEQPFVIYVFTDGGELVGRDYANQGFSLLYRLLPCA